MNRNKRTWTGSYTVHPQASVHLEVQVGDGAVGSVVVDVGEERIHAGRPHPALALGSGADLAGRELRVVADIRSVIPTVEEAGIRVVLRGGHEPRRITLRAPAEPSGSVTFLVRVAFEAQPAEPPGGGGPNPPSGGTGP